MTFNDIPDADGRRIMVGWMPQQPSPDRPWAGVQSIPRVLTLNSTPDGLRLRQEPVAELRALRGEHFAFEGESIADESHLLSTAGIGAGQWEIAGDFEPGSSSAFGLRVQLDCGEQATLGYSVPEETLFFERPGQSPIRAPLTMRDCRVRLHAFVDRSVGEAALCVVLDPIARCQGLSLFADGGEASVEEMDVWKLQ